MSDTKPSAQEIVALSRKEVTVPLRLNYSNDTFELT